MVVLTGRWLRSGRSPGLMPGGVSSMRNLLVRVAPSVRGGSPSRCRPLPERRVRVAVVKSSARRTGESTGNDSRVPPRAAPEFVHQTRRCSFESARRCIYSVHGLIALPPYYCVDVSPCSAHATPYACVRYRTEKIVGIGAQMRKFGTSLVWAVGQKR